MYTGGTTGRPKGVIWRLSDLLGSMGASVFRRFGVADPPGTLGEMVAIAAGCAGRRTGRR